MTIKDKTNPESSELHETSRTIILLILSATRRPILQTTWIFQNRELTSCFIQLRNSKILVPDGLNSKAVKVKHPVHWGQWTKLTGSCFLIICRHGSIIDPPVNLRLLEIQQDQWRSWADHHWWEEEVKQKISLVSTLASHDALTWWSSAGCVTSSNPEANLRTGCRQSVAQSVPSTFRPRSYFTSLPPVGLHGPQVRGWGLEL